MKHIIIFFVATAFSVGVFSQTKKVTGNLSTSDTADLTILNIYPDSFPNVSVVFKAETRKGEPVWNLTKEKMAVRENTQHCEVVSLAQISKYKPINIGIVIDHSGSMRMGIHPIVDSFGNPTNTYNVDSIAPIDNAKSAVKTFVSTFNTKKDFIGVIGFSEEVDEVLPLSQNVSTINASVDSMQAGGSTAFYDALIKGIEEVKKADGVKVLVALTDGQDNSSKSKWNEVVDIANKAEVPIYIVGLGNVNSDTLSLIAKSTKGQYYYTSSASSLNVLYKEISKQVQAFYELVYNSPNFSSADSTRQIALSFNIDSIYLVTNPSTKAFPTEVVAFVARKEREKRYPLYGGIALVVLAATGTIVYTYQKRKKS
ncbi:MULTISPECIES: vWA domain-containing protein [Niastella]|uniref:VWA domain-containing protein n=1 Tax=Niastella soli TaxID=2821487 RepID=A0ABS3YU55_9BACT|nr:VWA domain-containing protein [Niastella soli]MBO9201413.1 VWA domain-containing protein [Niastella soli]